MAWALLRRYNCYQCESNGGGFFIEVGIDDGRGQAVVRSFSDSEALEDYAWGVRLPLD